MSEEQQTHEPKPDATLERPAMPTTSLDRAKKGTAGDGEGGVGGDTAGAGSAGEKGFVQGRIAAARQFVAQRKAASIVFAGFLCFVAVFLVVAYRHTTGIPDEATILNDAQLRISAPECGANDFSADDLLVFEGAKVRSASRNATAVESSAAQFGASAYASADVALTWKSSAVKAVTTATLGYAKVNGEWVATGLPVDAKTSFEATAGINQSGVRANIDEILQKAEDSLGDEAGEKTAVSSSTSANAADSETTLLALYATASTKIESEDFNADAQTDTVKLACKKASSFVSYECDLTVVFSFKQTSGVWEIDSVSVDNADNAKTASYDALLGTWQSTFQAQETDGTKCLAASAAPLRVTITKVDPAKDGAAPKLTAKVDGIAHFHARPDKDSAGTDGDFTFSALDLTASLTGEEGGLVFTGDLPQQVNGTVSVELDFGSASDASAITAKVTSTYRHTGSFLLIPYDETLTYTDTFTLHRDAA